MEAMEIPATADPVLKDWLMKRNCSVSPRQFVAFYALLVACALLIALFPLRFGAWLVLPFTAVDLLVVGIAFVLYARHAVDYQRVRLFRNLLVIEQMEADRRTRFEFNPRWVRIETDAALRDPVRLVSRGQTVVVGQFLSWERRQQFVRELRSGLARSG